MKDKLLIKSSSEGGVRLEDGRSVGPVLQGGHVGDARSRHSGQIFPRPGGQGLCCYQLKLRQSQTCRKGRELAASLFIKFTLPPLILS